MHERLANLERNAGGANYSVILDNLKKLDKGEKPKDPNAPQKKFKIGELSITNINVHLDLLGGAAGALTKVDVPIHEIKLTNIGSPARLAETLVPRYNET